MNIKYIGYALYEKGSLQSALFGSTDVDKLDNIDSDIYQSNKDGDPDYPDDTLIDPVIIEVYAGVDEGDNIKLQSSKDFLETWSIAIEDIYDTKEEARSTFFNELFR